MYYEFDRGNVIVHDVGTGYADTAPVVLNGGPQPNTMEYDLEFPVTAQYALWARYTAMDSRPVDIFLDDERVARGFAAVTGRWQASSAQWEKQCDLEITAGKHCLKFICPGPCIPHIVAFRLDSSPPFPPGGKRKPRPLDPLAPVVWSGNPEPCRYDFAAYIRSDTRVWRGLDEGQSNTCASSRRFPSLSQPSAGVMGCRTPSSATTDLWH